ncbi:phosphotransferase [Paraglaciecola marina]|uniref:phosphotransferase n=1 Tax=Paraglaciecola marina TaxID=2500157 RepID=UPI00106187E6|nr:phosphotransferase [Paraglaciecola marina]
MKDLRDRMEQELRELSFIDPDFNLIPLNAGALNRSYRLETAEQCYFIKTFESDEIAGLDRQVLFDIQKQLYDHNLSVRPIYLSKSNHFQIDSWSKRQTLEHSKLSVNETTSFLASALATIHKTTIHAPTLDMPKQWQHYIDLLGSNISENDLFPLDTYTKTWYQECSKGLVFCHNDLALSHVTCHEPIKIFDWEYCANSSPYFDLASCIAINSLNHNAEEALCVCYAELMEQRVSDVVSRVKVMKPLVEFTNRLWYLAAKLTV